MSSSAESSSSAEHDVTTEPEDSAERGPPAGLGPQGAPHQRPPYHDPLTDEEWDRLRAPFAWEAYVIKTRAAGRTPGHLTGEDGPHPTVIDLYLRTEAIRDRLDWVLGPGRYSYRFETGPRDGGRQSLFCHLRIGGAVRTGTGTYSTLRTARKLALASAAAAFGIGTSGRSAGPVAAEKELRNEVPDPVLEALEEKTRPSPWTPEETP